MINGDGQSRPPHHAQETHFEVPLWGIRPIPTTDSISGGGPGARAIASTGTERPSGSGSPLTLPYRIWRLGAPGVTA